jgi:hypothetical protein
MWLGHGESLQVVALLEATLEQTLEVADMPAPPKPQQFMV